MNIAGRGTVHITCAAWLVAFASLGAAQNPAAAPAATPHPEHVRHSASARASAESPNESEKDKGKDAADKESKPTTPELPTDAAATPADISFKDGQLTVVAKNSDLNGILKQIAETSGMTIDGPGKDTRVFGVYGPGNPRDVLTDLLSDSGCNFMMVGDTADGAPRTLVLTALNGASGPAPTAATPPSVPPVEAQPPAPTQPQDDQELRMQRHLEQMQQMEPQAEPQ